MSDHRITCILVLGMHRSGTSAMAGILNSAGFTIGKDLMLPNEFNIKGYYENHKIYLFNDRILNFFGVKWHETFHLQTKWESDQIALFVDELKSLIRSEFDLGQDFLIKDPRISVLLPIYHQALEELNIEIKQIIMLRHPYEVCNSLSNRDNLPRKKSLLLWFDHLIHAELISRRYRRCFVSFNEVLNNPIDVIKKLRPILPQLRINQHFIKSHIDSSLKHFSEEDVSPTSDIGVVELYELLLQFCQVDRKSNHILLQIDLIRKRYRFLKENIGFVFQESSKGIQLREWQSQQKALENKIHQSNKALQDLEEGYNDLTIKLFQKQQESTTLINHVRDLQESLRHKENKIVEYKNISNLLRNESNQIRQALDEKKKYSQDLVLYHQKELAQLTSSINDKKIKIKTLIEKNENLKSDIESLNRRLVSREKDFENLLNSWSLRLGRFATKPFDTMYKLARKNATWLQELFKKKNWIILVNALAKEPLSKIISNAKRKFLETNEHQVPEKEAQRKLIGVTTLNGSVVERTDRKNILLVAHSVGKYIYGGERSFLDLAKMISKYNFNLFICLPRRNYEFEDLLYKYACKIYVFKYTWWNTSKILDNDAVTTFKNIYSQARIDLVHVNTIMVLDPIKAANDQGIRSIIHAREIISKDKNLLSRLDGSTDEILRILGQYSDHFIVNSEATKKEFQGLGQISMLPNVVSDNFFDLPVKPINTEAIVVGLISSNIEKKGVWDFVNLAQEVYKARKNIFFTLIGEETKLTEEVKAHQKSGQIKANLSIAGYFPKSIEAFRDLDIIVNFSHFAESFGRTILEGMASAKVPIIYNYGALPELVKNNETGFIIPYLKWESAIEILIKLADTPSLIQEIGLKARLSSNGIYRYSKASSKLNKIYETIFSSTKFNMEWINNRSRDELLSHSLKELRIGYFLWHFPVPSETFVINEIRFLKSNGYDIIVFCKGSPHKDATLDFDVEIIRVRDHEDLRSKIVSTRRNIMHSHFAYPTATKMLWPACEIAKVPFTFIAHGQDIFKYESIEHNQIDKVVSSKYCLRVIVPGEFHMNFLANLGVPYHKIVINAQAINTAVFQAKKTIKKTEKSICSIGRFVDKKGFEYLIRSALYLEKHNIKVYLYGYGPNEETYRNIIDDEGIQNVVLAGPLKGAEAVSTALMSHDMFVQPSIRAANGDMDGLPTVIIEAMTVGVPVLSTIVSSISEILHDGYNGFVIREKSPADIAETALRVYEMNNRELTRITRNAAETVKKVYNINSSINFLLRLWYGKGLDIVIVTFNELDRIKPVIERLYRFTNTAFKVYIIDNASEAPVQRFLSYLETNLPNLKVILNKKNVFVGPATNIGLDEGKNPVAVYLCSREGYIMSHNWDREIINYMDQHPRAGLAGTLGYSPSYYTGKDFPTGLDKFDKFRNQDFATNNPTRIFKHVQGGILTIRRSMYEEIGGFSELVPHNHTDVEYSYYCESMGWKLGNISSVMSLYNKTRPGPESRVNSQHKIIHPLSESTVSDYTEICSRTSLFCTICGSKFPLLTKSQNENDPCHKCGSSSEIQFFYRYLANSDLLYRKQRIHYLSNRYHDFTFIKKAIDCTLINSNSIEDNNFKTCSTVFVSIRDTPIIFFEKYLQKVSLTKIDSLVFIYSDKEIDVESRHIITAQTLIPTLSETVYDLPECKELIFSLQRTS